MSQEQNDNNNNDNRPLVIRHSPPRATINRAFIPYDKTYRGNKSPSDVLRMISRLPHRSTFRTEQEEQSSTLFTKPQAPTTSAATTPLIKEQGYTYAQFKEQYMRIKRMDPNARPGVQLDFIHKKVRHLDTLSDTLSEFTFHTSTNYSRLDDTRLPRLPPPPPLPLATQQEGQQDYAIDDDDARSLATQDMLLDEDDGKVVWDTQQITEMQRKLELIQPPSSFGEQQPLPPPLRSPSRHSFHSSSSVGPKSTISSIQQQQRRDKGKEKEEEVIRDTMSSPKRKASVQSAFQAPEQPDYGIVEDMLQENGSDWGMDDDYGYDYWKEGEKEEEDEGEETHQSDMMVESSSNTRTKTGTRTAVKKRVVPGNATIPNITAPGIQKRPFGQKFIRDRFSNKLNYNTRLTTAVSYFDKLWDAYASQLSYDLKAYMKHRENTTNDDENDKALLKEDVILLMKRQRVIHEQSSLESVAYKHLPRESWDMLCTSALKNNILYPPVRDSVVSSAYDRDDDDDEEEDEDDDETIPDHQRSNRHHIDFE